MPSSKQKETCDRANRWNDPSGVCFVAPFVDEAEEKAWVQQAESLTANRTLK